MSPTHALRYRASVRDRVSVKHAQRKHARYDTRGNLTNDGSKTYGYDYDNRMISASGGVTLNYDPAGRLHQVAGAATTRFLYDGADLIAEYNTSGTVLRRYVHGPGVDEPLLWYEGSGTSDKRYLMADERGSVIGVTNASGSVTTVNKYDVYGVPGTSNAGRFQYTGQTWLEDVGLYHYKARAYDPELGRFLQTDPIGVAGGMNIYAYVANDPANLIDPSGLDHCGDDGFEQWFATGSRWRYTGKDTNENTTTFSHDCWNPWEPDPHEMYDDPSEAYLGSTAVARRTLAQTTCNSALQVANQNQAAVQRARVAWQTLVGAGQAYNIDPSMLAAIGVRESGFRNVPEIGGGPGRGVFQLTATPAFGVTAAQAGNLSFSANYAASLLDSNRALLSARFPQFTAPQLLQATAASYNFGPGNINGNPNTIDLGTTGNNYGSNIVNLMSCFP